MKAKFRLKDFSAAVGRYTAMKDRLWFSIWGAGIALIWIWNLVFLNKPALHQIESGFLNTLSISSIVIVLAALMGWGVTLIDDFLNRRFPGLQLSLIFLINLIRSVPQIVGTLMGYVLLTVLIQNGVITSRLPVLLCMALIIAFFL